MNFLLKLLPIKLKDYLFYLPLNIYRGLNNQYQNQKLPTDLREKLSAEILAEKITKISVIVTTRNRLPALKKFSLASLERLHFTALPYEIIIIDNDSNDGTYSYLIGYAQTHPKVKIFRERKIGASAGRNHGIKMASGELVVFMDDDCEVDPDWLSRIHEKYLEKNYFLGQGQIYDTGWKKNLINSTTDIFPNNMATGNMSIKRKIFDYVCFDENIPLYHEDENLIRQIKVFWPDFPYFIDTFPIKHHRAASIYRTNNKNYNPKGMALSAKMYALTMVSESILKRNLDIDTPFYILKFVFKEIFFLPLETIFFIKFDIILLIKIKTGLLKQLLRLKK